jgi:hypothetical protein
MANRINFYERSDLFFRAIKDVPSDLERIRLLKSFFEEVYKAGYQTGYNHSKGIHLKPNKEEDETLKGNGKEDK